MASLGDNMTEMNVLDDDVSGIIGEYSIPNLAEITSESRLTKSQYAKVIFHDLLPCYPTDTDIWCRYTLTDDIKSRHGDRIALYRVGWVSVHDHVQFEVAPITNSTEEMEFRVLFKAEVLPKDTTEFYQLCYVNVDDAVCGASVPFQFRHPIEEELCEVEEQDGLLVVRSTTAVSEKKLRDAAKKIRELESEKLAREEKVQCLENTNDSLSVKMEELTSIQQREAQDFEKLKTAYTQALEHLRQADKTTQALSAKVESLNRDNCTLNELLKNESQKINTEEISRYKLQIDNMQQMLDALVDSKELASQALQCEQSKVMTLNIEHDKYKFRSQQLEEENRGLLMDMQQKRSVIDTLEIRLKQNEVLLETKFKENEVTMSKLQQVIKQIGQLQFELNQVKEKNDCLQLQLGQRDNQILMLDMEVRDFRQKGSSFDQLNEEYTNLKRKLKDYDGVWTKINGLKEENDSLQNKVRCLQKEISELVQYKQERDRLSSEYELLSVSHVALQNELYTSLNNSTMHELHNERSLLQNPHAQETASSRSVLSIEQLKGMLTAAEESNALLMNELKQIKDLQPDWKFENHNNGNLLPSATASSTEGCVRCTTMFRAPARNSELKKQFQTLKEDREKFEAELQDMLTKESDFMVRCDLKSKRLVVIEEDVLNEKKELKLVIEKNRQAKEDLMQLNNRMLSIQQQILSDDQREGRDFYETGDQERLERMSKRCHELQCIHSETASEIHDRKQNIQVLDQERTDIEEELRHKPQIEKKWAEEKCKVLENLVNLDQKLIMFQEREMSSVVEGIKASQDLLAENLENSAQSCEVYSTNLSSSEEALIPQAVKRVSKSDTGTEGNSSVLEVCRAGRSTATGATTAVPVESIEKAVETGICEGVLCGINTLKQEVFDQLGTISGSSSSESITNIERKCALVNKECQEQEQLLQKNLAAALKNTVHQELVTLMGEGTTDTGLARSDVEVNLKLRLDMAAEEYKKLYMQKSKLEKQLIKLQQKQLASSQQSTSVITSTEETSGFVCPICGVCFQSANRESFTCHYNDHLF